MNKGLVRGVSWLLVLGLVGCSVKEAPPVDHLGPVEPVTNERKPDERDNRINRLNVDGAKSYQELDISRVMVQAARNPKATEVLIKSLLPLADALLTPSVYTSSIVYETKFFQALREFHEGILYVDQLSPELLVESGVLARYKKVLMVDCGINLEGMCPNLKIYSKEGRFPRVLTLVAARETDVLEYYRVLRAAIERYSAATDESLDYLYLRRANELARKYVEGTQGKERLDSAAIDALRDHARLTQNILLNFDPSKVSQDKLDLLMKNFNPWDMSRKSSDVLNFGIDRLLQLAAKGYLYKNRTQGELNPDFKAKVESILGGQDPLYGMGLAYLAKWIKSRESGGILKNFGLTDAIEANEYTYLVDRLFYSHFNTGDAVAFWKYTNQDRDLLFKAINQFVRLQVAYMIVWTNEQMNDFFKSNVDEKGRPLVGDILTLLQQAVANSLKLHAEWDRSLTRISGLMNFVDHEFGSVDLFALDHNDPYRVLTESITSLQQNIKMLSVYPNMMMLVYLMAKENFQATINTFWGSFSITADKVIEWFFIQVLSPWFSFGTDNMSLSQVELLYALHFTLQTETFSAYKSNPLLPVDAASFFKEITNKLTNSFVQILKDDLNGVKTNLTANAQSMRDAISACEEERVLQPKEAELGHLLPRTYTRNISYSNLSSQMANGFSSRSNGTPLAAISTFYEAGRSSGSNMKKELINLRTATEARLLNLQNMKGILTTYLLETGGDVQAVTKAYNEEVAKLTDLRNEYLLTIHQTVAKIGDCDLLLYKHEMDLRNALYQREQAYLGDVYDKLTNLNSSLATNADSAKVAAEALNQALAAQVQKVAELPSAYRDKGGYDRYRQNGRGFYYDYYKFDAVLRARAYLESYSPGATKVILPNFTELNIPEYQSPVAHPIEPWSSISKESFIADGMRQFVLDLQVEDNIVPNFLLSKLDVMAQLYRIGPIDKDTGAPGCVDDQGAGKLSRCLKVTPKQIIDTTFKTLELANTSDADLNVLSWSGAAQKFDDDFWSQLAMEKDTRRPLGLADLALQRVASDGEINDGTMSSFFFDLTRDYYDTETAVGNFLFQPREEVKSLIKANYARYVQEYQRKTDAFMKDYRDLQKSDPYRVTQIRRTPKEMIYVPTELAEDRVTSVPQYISNVRLNRYSSLVSNFNLRTAHAFEK